MKTFTEVFEEIRSGVGTTPKGNVKKIFSKTDFNKLAIAFLNESDYKVNVAKVKGDELVISEIFPVQEFRKMIKKILIQFGVDKVEAEKVMNEYTFTNVDGFYEVCSELIYKYMEAGKKFDFLSKEDFQGSIVLNHVPETEGTFRTIKKKDDSDPIETFKQRTEAHYVIKSKSKAPKWKKHNFR